MSIFSSRHQFDHSIDFVINPRMRAKEVSSVNSGAVTQGDQFARIPPDFFYSPGEGSETL